MGKLLRRFAKNLRRIRLERGFTQEVLAHTADLHRTYIGAIEREERNVSLNNVEKIALALRVDPVILFSKGNSYE